MVKKINEAEFRSEAVKGCTVVDFSATWCGPCKMLAPVLEEVSEELTDIDFYNVDIDADADLAMEFGIMSVPALLVMKDGEKKGILVGFKQKDALLEDIKKLF